MSNVLEIEAALRQLPMQDQWQIARWLLDELEENGHGKTDSPITVGSSPLPDYAGRRRHIFGKKILPNMVLAARDEERW